MADEISLRKMAPCFRCVCMQGWYKDTGPGIRPRVVDHGVPGFGSVDPGSCGGRTGLAGELGFEPRQTESESVVLPLHHSPIFKNNFNNLRLFLKFRQRM